MTVTYMLTVRINGPDDATARRVAEDVATQLRDQYRHSTAPVTPGDPQRVRSPLSRLSPRVVREVDE